MSPLKIAAYFAVTVALAVVVLGMVRPPVNSAPQLSERVWVAPAVSRFDDQDRGVTCYVYVGEGIACVVTETLAPEGAQ